MATIESESRIPQDSTQEDMPACITVSIPEQKTVSTIASVIDAERFQSERESRMRMELKEVEEEITTEYNRVMKQFDHDTRMLRWKKDMLEHALLQFSRPGCYGTFGVDVRLSNGEYTCRCDNCKHARDCYHADEARRGEI